MAQTSSSDHSADMRGASKEANNLVGSTAVDDQDGFHNDHQDHLDMQRLGKKQQFKRNFSLWSSIGFVAIYMATWEFVLISLAPGFTNSGYAGVFWCFVTTTTAYSAVVASLAEMASMAPTSGGQYHWVSEFSPPRYQKILSYASGWMTTLGWLASFASSCYTIAFQVQACINVTMPDFAFTTWQIALIMWAVIAVTVAFNTWGTAFFPQLETSSLVGHILGFFVVMIPLWVLCDKNSAHDVFLQFTDQSGWNNMDSIAHLAEEVKNASIVVPRAIWWSYVGNVLFGFVMLITMLFCIGPLDSVIESDWPFITLFDRTGSQSLNLFFNVILWLLVYLGNITTLATCARETWAFARDRGLPGSQWIGHMDKKWHMPFRAVYLVSIGAALLSLIQIGSDVAFTVLVSLSTLGIMSTYLLSIGCVLLKRIKGEKLPFARWSLGRFGLTINAFSVLYSLFIVILCCFPLNLPVDTASANWAPLIWVGVMIIARARESLFMSPSINVFVKKFTSDPEMLSTAASTMDARNLVVELLDVDALAGTIGAQKRR
ncbi:amino acid permease 2 (AAP-2) [Fusarium albosuccineum]|uniref:Amino acid permease 2 (AAP-2) n=1 Tax=Fusarium albosuccineum TaxID=1237068 RepID=A0A8H4P5K5_9HYPO|nr:amino acid permease 2 (AAP-2) [Fusarium albosuccineum]